MRTVSLLGIAVLLAAAGCSKSEYADEAAGGMAAPAADLKAPTGSANQEREAPAIAPDKVPQRAVIRNGALTVRVENFEKAEDKVSELVQAVGGYVDSAESSDLAGAAPVLNMKLKVPARQFEPTLEKLEGLGARLAKKVSSEDVTASLVDMQARVKIMKAQETVYRGLLAKSKNTQEMYEVQEKLMNLRGMIESLEGQQKSLAGLAALSTIELTLQQSAEGMAAATGDPNWAREAWGASMSALGTVARVGGSGLIWLAVFSPFWLPAAWLLLRQRRSRRTPAQGPHFDIAG
ncbi:MAG TPA: DUF4349 domain-containing protein [Fimbriimonadaceae bacterium]|nr:DUF4349 domain-containing protein [Fimbriimonadaceae bacterium]